MSKAKVTVSGLRKSNGQSYTKLQISSRACTYVADQTHERTDELKLHVFVWILAVTAVPAETKEGKKVSLLFLACLLLSTHSVSTYAHAKLLSSEKVDIYHATRERENNGQVFSQSLSRASFVRVSQAGEG